MSDDGVFAVHRGVFKHQIFADEPYTEREAWLWLVGNAVWKPSRVRVKDTVFSLERGQCAYSIRFLAEQWQWSKTRVSRFLELLKNERMIGTQAGRDATLITVCNYNEYQLSPGHRKDADRDAGGTQAGRRRDKEEELNKLIKEEEKKDRGAVAPKHPRASRGTRLPDGWEPDDALRAYALTLIPVERLQPEIEKFTDYWKAASGSKSVKADWSAAFRNWVRNSLNFGGGGNGQGRSGNLQSAGGNIIAAQQKLIERIDAFNRPLEVCGGQGAPVVRLLPQGGRE